jgi:hypothetical protein
MIEMANKIMNHRIFLSQSHSHGICPRSVWTIMEGICTFGFAILDVGPFCALHGNCHCCSSAPAPLPVSYHGQSIHANPNCTTQFTWGPLCFIVAAFITTSHPLRHPLQIIVCVGQIYGLILYYATSMFDHYYKAVTYSRPEFLYFWGYYFFMNFIWMVFPGSKLGRGLGKEIDDELLMFCV